MAYDQVEPFGETRDDLRAGIIASTVYNVMRGKGAPAMKPSDFMPRFGEANRGASLEEVTHKLDLFAAAHNGKRSKP